MNFLVKMDQVKLVMPILFHSSWGMDKSKKCMMIVQIFTIIFTLLTSYHVSAILKTIVLLIIP